MLYNNQRTQRRHYHLSGPRKAFSSKKPLFSEKLLAFLSSTMISFCKIDKVKGIPLSRNFINNVRGMLNNAVQLHHSHVTGEITSYSHSYCNPKNRENHFKIPVVTHNLFRFEFFFLLKGLRAGVWRRKDIKIGGKNPTDVNFASIGNQIQFPDTIKHFQESLVL